MKHASRPAASVAPLVGASPTTPGRGSGGRAPTVRRDLARTGRPIAKAARVTRRTIAPEIFEGDWFGRLSDREAVVWIGCIIALADDQGRFADNAVVIRSRLFPHRDVPVGDVSAALERFVAASRLHRYQADGGPVLQIVHWWRHQRPQWARRSTLPAPTEWTDRIRTREGGAYVEQAWKLPGGFTCAAHLNESAEIAAAAAGDEEPQGRMPQDCVEVGRCEPSLYCGDCGTWFVAGAADGPLYECACGTRFTHRHSADGVGRRCPSCRRVGMEVAELGCPECGTAALVDIGGFDVDPTGPPKVPHG